MAVRRSNAPQHRAGRTRLGAGTRILSRSLEISQRSLIGALAGRAPLAILKIVMSDRIECDRCWSNYSLSCHTTALGWIKTEELYMTEQFSVRPIGGGMSELLYDEGLRRHMLQVYNYMGLGLAVTGLVAFGVAATPSLYQAIFGTSLKWLALFAPLAFVIGRAACRERVCQ